MNEIDFMGELHGSTGRDYLSRAIPDKPRRCRIAKEFGPEYWTAGDYGYKNYRYDGRHRHVAERIVNYYGLERPGARVLDVGCGPGYLIADMMIGMPGIEAFGIDVSAFAIDELSLDMTTDRISLGRAQELPFEDRSFDLVLSINVLHNLGYRDLKMAISEIERVGRVDKWICVESWRTEEEKFNLQNWALTCESFYPPEEWAELLSDLGYSGDIGFIYFS